MNVEANIFDEGTINATDGLKLYFRTYGKGQAGTPVLCLSGLTRNCRDFHDIALRLSAYRCVVAMDYRGRGRSDYDPNPMNYHPGSYITDALALLDYLKIEKAIVVGTSLGGICAMMLGATAPKRIKAIVLNDIGPKLADGGRDRIAGYVGRDVRFLDLTTAANALKQQFGGAYPGTNDAFWREQADLSFLFDHKAGNFRPNYDLQIAVPIAQQASQPAPDLWPLFGMLKPFPMLAVRGALSDLLDATTFERMASEKPDIQRVLVPNRGHVPLPQEEPFASALEAFVRAN